MRAAGAHILKTLHLQFGKHMFLHHAPGCFKGSPLVVELTGRVSRSELLRAAQALPTPRRVSVTASGERGDVVADCVDHCCASLLFVLYSKTSLTDHLHRSTTSTNQPTSILLFGSQKIVYTIRLYRYSNSLNRPLPPPPK